MVSDAVQKGLLHDRESEHRTGAGATTEGPVCCGAALDEVGDGIRSVPEGDLRLLLKRARVPMPMFNARLYDGDTLIAIVDCWWPDAGVAGEVDSREYHYRADDWQRTMRAARSACGPRRSPAAFHSAADQGRTRTELCWEILSALAAGCGPAAAADKGPPRGLRGCRRRRPPARRVARHALRPTAATSQRGPHQSPSHGRPKSRSRSPGGPCDHAPGPLSATIGRPCASAQPAMSWRSGSRSRRTGPPTSRARLVMSAWAAAVRGNHRADDAQ